MSAASTENPNICREILVPTGRIFKAHSIHFNALSIFFLLPMIFSLAVYPCLHLAIFHPNYHFSTIFTTQLLQLSHLNFAEIIALLVYTMFIVLLYLCALATITDSAVHAFYDTPINLLSSIKSIKSSFFPLLSTFIVSQTIVISIILVFALVLVIVFQILQVLGLKYDQFLFLGIFALIMLVAILIWLQINWSLAYVVAVVESKWGFETLRRSAYLIKGKRWATFFMMLWYYGTMSAAVVAVSILLIIVEAAKGNNWKIYGAMVIPQTVQCLVTGFWMMKRHLVSNVVLYMYCKDLNGEKLPLKIGDEFANEYVSLPLDDEKNHAPV